MTDDGGATHRVDVVGLAVSAPEAIVNLRRELARLSQQAGAVERSLEDQRRDRRDTMERFDRATQRVLALEARLGAADAEVKSARRLHEGALAELAKVRGERDDLVHVAGTAKSVAEELARARSDGERLRSALDEATKKSTALEEELAAVRRRQYQHALEVTDTDVELGKLREHIERGESAAAQARALAERAGEDLAVARDDQAAARAVISRLREELDAAREESARQRASDEAQGNDARHEHAVRMAERAAELAVAAESLAHEREAVADAKAALARSAAELEATRRDRDALESTSSRHEGEATELRVEAAVLREENMSTRAALGEATGRAEAGERALAELTAAMHHLRDEVAAGFARHGISAPVVIDARSSGGEEASPRDAPEGAPAAVR